MANILDYILNSGRKLVKGDIKMCNFFLIKEVLFKHTVSDVCQKNMCLIFGRQIFSFPSD